jgi:hypothetical protein
LNTGSSASTPELRFPLQHSTTFAADLKLTRNGVSKADHFSGAFSIGKARRKWRVLSIEQTPAAP